jgi:F0F1-type ATP synthase alpha subunit
MSGLQTACRLSTPRCEPGRSVALLSKYWLQLDTHRVRGVALTTSGGLARGMVVEDSGGPLRAPVGRNILSRMFDVFGNAIDRQEKVTEVEWRSVHHPPPLARRSTKSELFETGIKVIDVLVPLERGGKAGLFGGAGVGFDEVVTFPGDVLGIAFNVDENDTGVVLLGKSVSRVGGKAQRAAYRAVAGDLKLAYAQFEELETFVRFGARLDEDSRKTIEHGRRIRACLKQPEVAPVAVPAQIAVLLALVSGLFDGVPLDQMTDAEHALRRAAADIPAEVRERLDSAEKLSDEDRETIIEMARQALEAFSPVPDSASEPEQETDELPKPAAKAEPQAGSTPALNHATGGRK